MSDLHWLFNNLYKGKTMYCIKSKQCVIVGNELRGDAEYVFSNYIEYINEYLPYHKHFVWMDEKKRICVRKKKAWELI